jgi:hypothetical protein
VTKPANCRAVCPAGSTMITAPYPVAVTRMRRTTRPIRPSRPYAGSADTANCLLGRPHIVGYITTFVIASRVRRCIQRESPLLSLARSLA